MIRPAFAQLELGLFERNGAPRPAVETTRALRGHRSCRRVLEHVRYVRRFFPELDDTTLRVGLTRAASGMAVPGGNEIWLNPSHVSRHTIAHEMVHLLQKRDLGIPQGERACDVFSLARHWTLNDVNPGYVRIPASLVNPDGTLPIEGARLVHRAAAESVAERDGGLRNYIARFEERLREWAPTLDATRWHRSGRP